MTCHEKTVVVRALAIGAGMPKIIVPLVGEGEAELLAQAAAAAREPGVDAVEWRADLFADSCLPVLPKLRGILGELPLLFTFRTKGEGGAREISPEDYCALNLAAAGTGCVDLVDVESYTAPDPAAHIRQLHELGVKVVASRHDFEKTPHEDTLRADLERGWALGADISKLAVMPRTKEDVDRLLKVTRALHAAHGRPLIAISMGEMGEVSRIEGEKYGCAMTFGALGQTSAPGQIPVSRLRRELERVHRELE